MKLISEIARDIDDFVEYCSSLYMTCAHLNIRLPSSPSLNFRDALSHYIRHYDTSANDEKLKQEASIGEHLSRGFKDGCVFILYEMKERLTNALEKAKTREQKIDFRKHLHEYKRMEIEIRRGSKPAGISDLFKFVNKLIDLIRSTETVFLGYNFPFKANANYRLPPT